MSLNNEQLATLKTAIAGETDPEFVALRDEGATGAMAEWYNVPSTFVVWKTILSEHDITGKESSIGSVWSWTIYINRSQAERDGWARMFNGTYTINPSLANVRQAIQDIFSGAGGSAQRTHLLAMAKRFATKGEKIFASGTGTDQAPGTLVFEGSIGDSDVVRALQLP
jgi:hypothetical protein